MNNISEKTDKIFIIVTAISAVCVILLMIGFLFQLLLYAMPAIKRFGIGFLFSTEWDPANQLYGAANSIIGTLITTVIALILAVPFSFGIALFLTEIAHPVIGKILGSAIELLATIPSIIYGMWGLFVLIPFLESNIYPKIMHSNIAIGKLLGWENGLLPFLSGDITGFGLLTSGIVLAVMILPFISSVMRDVIKMVPPVLKEAAYGIGATRHEVSINIIVKYGLNGFAGALFLGLGRAIGETMAVLFIIGNTQQTSFRLFDSGTTIASTLANNFGEAEGILKPVLFELGLILLLISLCIQIVSQYMLNYINAKAGK